LACWGDAELEALVLMLRHGIGYAEEMSPVTRRSWLATALAVQAARTAEGTTDPLFDEAA